MPLPGVQEEDIPVDVTLVNLIFSLRLEKSFPTATLYHLFRTEFETALRKAVSCTLPACKPCSASEECAFHNAFARALTPDPSALARFQKPSAPFAFQLPVISPQAQPGAVVELGLVLVGSATRYLNAYLDAVAILIPGGYDRNKLPLSIIRVESAGYDGSRYGIREGNEAPRLDGVAMFSFNALAQSVPAIVREVRLDIMLPLRIIHAGSPLRELTFSPFIRALMRRVSALAYYYGGIEADMDFRWLAQQSEAMDSVLSGCHWVHRQDGAAGAGMSGLQGEVMYRGDLVEYLPFLLMGKFVNVGKGAPFGAGRFRISEVTQGR